MFALMNFFSKKGDSSEKRVSDLQLKYYNSLLVMVLFLKKKNEEKLLIADGKVNRLDYEFQPLC